MDPFKRSKQGGNETWAEPRLADVKQLAKEAGKILAGGYETGHQIDFNETSCRYNKYKVDEMRGNFLSNSNCEAGQKCEENVYHRLYVGR